MNSSFGFKQLLYNSRTLQPNISNNLFECSTKLTEVISLLKIHRDESQAKSETVAVEANDTYEYTEGAHYVIAILLLYSISVICLICVSTKKSQLQYFEDSDDPHDNVANSFLRQTNGENIRHQALENLRNPLFRKQMWDIYMENPNTYKMKTIELKKMQHIDRKLKNYTYKTYASDILPDRRSHTFRPNSEQAQHLFLLKDLDKLDNFSTNLHMNVQQPWWQNKAQWHNEASSVNQDSMSSSMKSTESTAALRDLTLANSTNSLASRFKVDKSDKDLV